METATYVGIDVAKARLDIAVRPSGQQWVTATDPASLDDLVGQLHDLQPELIVLEATGGREGAVVAALATAGLPLAVVNPRQVRDASPGSGPAGQDRCARCSGPGPLCPSHPPHASPPA